MQPPRKSLIWSQRHLIRRKTKTVSSILSLKSREQFSQQVLPWKFANNSKSVKWRRGRVTEVTLTWPRTCSSECRFILARVKRHSLRWRNSVKWQAKTVLLMLQQSVCRGRTQKLMIVNRKRFLPISKERHTFMASNLCLCRRKMRQFWKVGLLQRSLTMRQWKKTKTMAVFRSALLKLMR